jgi:alkylation response protein AidB-like acyl-CoA dehydrogenase
MPVRRRLHAGLCELQHRDAAEADTREWRLRAREFADEVVSPLGLALDRLSARQTIAPGSPLHEFLELAHAEGFTRLSDSPAAGGAGIGRDAEYVVLEEIAAADAGLAALLISGTVATERGGPSVRLHSRARSGRFRVVDDGCVWRVTGATGAPVIGAAIATHAAIVCRAAGLIAGQALVIVPLDRVGVRRRLVDCQVGLRSGAAASFELDSVAIERSHLLGWGDRGSPLLAGALALEHLAVAVVGIGIARSAYEGAVRWSSEHGVATGRRTALMRAILGRARSVTRAAYCDTHSRLDAGRAVSAGHAVFAGVLASQAATELARQALWMTGPGPSAIDGVEYLDGSRFYPDKLVRDAHEHGFLLPRRPASARKRPDHQQEQRSAIWGL